jgi:hypothetical protein
LAACRSEVCYPTEVRDVSWGLSECAVLLEDAVGVYATGEPPDTGLVRTVIVALAGLKAVATSDEDDAAELADALWLARTLALEAARACRDAAPAPQLDRCAALCERAAAVCEAAIRAHAPRL